MADATASAQGEDVDESRPVFAGLSFFLLQRVPQRNLFIQLLKQNGGEIAILDKHADIVIADHARKDSPPDAVSYTWIEQSLSDGQIANRDEHPAGPKRGTPRRVSAGTPINNRRNAYTKEDDAFLRDYVLDQVAKGKKELGNDIYKPLAELAPRHPWQSWRDRYVKYVRVQKPSSSIGLQNGSRPSPEQTDETVPPNSTDIPQQKPLPCSESSRSFSPPRAINDNADQDQPLDAAQQSRPHEQDSVFTSEDRGRFLIQGDILTMMYQRNSDAVEEYWTRYAATFPTYSADDWRQYWEDHARIEYNKQRESLKPLYDFVDQVYDEITRQKPPETQECAFEAQVKVPPSRSATFVQPSQPSMTSSREVGQSVGQQKANDTQNHVLMESRQINGLDSLQTFDPGTGDLLQNATSSRKRKRHSPQAEDSIDWARRRSSPRTGSNRNQNSISAARSANSNDLPQSQAGTRSPLDTQTNNRGSNGPAQRRASSPNLFVTDDEANSPPEKPIEIYQFRDIIDDDKENIQFDPDDQPLTNGEESSLRLEEGLQAFTDPPADFNIVSVEDEWHDISDSDDENDEEDARALDPGSHQQQSTQSQPNTQTSRIGSSSTRSRSTTQKSTASKRNKNETSTQYYSVGEGLVDDGLNDRDHSSPLNVYSISPSNDDDVHTILNDVQLPDDESSHEEVATANQRLSQTAPDASYSNTRIQKPQYRGLERAGYAENSMPSSSPRQNDHNGISGADDEENYTNTRHLPSSSLPISISISSSQNHNSIAAVSQDRPTGNPYRASNHARIRSRYKDTQALLDEDTQIPDFDMPLPPSDCEPEIENEVLSEAGQGFKSSEDEDFENPRPSMTAPLKPRIQGPRYAKLASGEASNLASIPTPPRIANSSTTVLMKSARSKAVVIPSSRSTPVFPSSTTPQLCAKLSEQDTERYVAAQVRRGFDESDVYKALWVTSFNSILAEKVLEAVKKGNGIPWHIPGVWQEEDDKAMKGSDAAKLRRLESFHGRQSYLQRKEFLTE